LKKKFFPKKSEKIHIRPPWMIQVSSSDEDDSSVNDNPQAQGLTVAA
jgi:hypothetical protein